MIQLYWKVGPVREIWSRTEKVTNNDASVFLVRVQFETAKDKQPTTSNREHRKDNNSNNTTTIHNVSFCYRLADNEDNNSNNNNNLSFVLFLPPLFRLYGDKDKEQERVNKIIIIIK